MFSHQRNVLCICSTFKIHLKLKKYKMRRFFSYFIQILNKLKSKKTKNVYMLISILILRYKIDQKMSWGVRSRQPSPGISSTKSQAFPSRPPAILLPGCVALDRSQCTHMCIYGNTTSSTLYLPLFFSPCRNK